MANYSEWDSALRAKLKILLLIITTSFVSNALVQESASSPWDGEWVAEGTLFRIGVSVTDNEMEVVQIESLGQIWTSEVGHVAGNIATVEIAYAGATGIIQAELIDDNTAILFAATCVPEFMVVCALSKDRQAIFKKVSD